MSVINTNLNALVSQESSRASNLKLSQSMERLSTGKRINSAKDDAAGLSISNRMTTQVRGIQMAMKNSNDAISMTQTAEGAYGQVGNVLQRMRELAVQSATATMSGSDRAALQLEVTQLTSEIDHIATTTNFNNIKLLDGSAKDMVIQTGANQADKIKMSFDSVKTNHIGSDIQPSVTSYGGSKADLGALSDGDLVINGVTVGSTFAFFVNTPPHWAGLFATVDTTF
jgi:flagellin